MFGAPTSLKFITPLLALAIFLRLTALALPAFSTDTSRFLADGLNVAAGKNPYTAPAPIAIEYPHLRSFYPPLQEFAFGALAQLWPSQRVFRVFGGLAELAFVLWFFYRKRKTGVAPAVALFLLFNPLSIHEVWREGHLDHIGAIFLYLAIVNLRAAFAYRRKLWRSCVFMLLGVGWKFTGILAAAFRLRGRSHSPLFNSLKKISSPFTLGAVLFFAAQFLPAFFFTPFAEQGFMVYVQYWHHGNGLVALFSAFGFAAPHGVYLVQRAIMLLAFGSVLLYLWRKIRLYDAVWFSVGSLVVLFPVQHAWYYFLLLPAILVSKKWRNLLMLLCCLTPLTYLGYTESFKSAGFVVVLAVWIAGCIFHFTRQKNYRLR